MKIVVLDAATLGADLDLSPLFACGEVSVFENTGAGEVARRVDGADVVVLNKVKMNADTLAGARLPALICVAATGYDNVDLDFCRQNGVAVCNVAGYSTDSVAEITVTLALALFCRLPAYSRFVESGAYTRGGVANCLVPPYKELRGKIWGIVGYGSIGAQVAAVARAFGCHVLAVKRTPAAGVDVVPLDELCRRADVISVHLPLTDATRGIIGERELALMKKDAILVNVARGAVIDEAAAAKAVKEGRLGGLGADVYTTEPMPENHPFYALLGKDNVLLTPHMAWGAVEARERCLAEIIENIGAFFRGERRSRVD